MFKKPFFISLVMTLLACVPLYFLSTQEFSFSTSSFPLFALSLFIFSLLTSFWTQTSLNHEDSDFYEDASDFPRESGNVKWFNADKGFGFITRDSNDDIFVHFRSIRGKGRRVLHDGQRVEFVVREGEKGLQADDVAVAR